MAAVVAGSEEAMSGLIIADAMEAEGYPLTPEQREIIEAAEAQLSDAYRVPNEPEGFAELVAEYRAKMDAANSMPRLDHRRAPGLDGLEEGEALYPEAFIGADHAGGPDKAATTMWVRGPDGKPVLIADVLDGLRVAAHQAGVSSELLTDSYNELVKVLDEGREEASALLNEQEATDTLARPLFDEAARRIVEQDAASTKRKKHKAKKKRLKKLAKKQRGKRG